MLVTLALYHRDALSQGNSRRVFGYEAYHWGILLQPADGTSTESTQNVYSFDATDASDIDPVTFRLRNPTMDWWLRAQANPAPNPKLLGQLAVGAIPDDSPLFAKGDDGEAQAEEEALRAFFTQIPLPVKNTHPQQSCVTWAVAAIGRMQAEGWARGFALDALKDAALAYADERMKRDSAEPTLKYYGL